MKAHNGQYELAVEINGRSVKEFGSAGRTYIEGRVGSSFTLKFRNNSPSRVLAVFSIDSLCVLDGKGAQADSGGYVISGYSSLDIKGWRTSVDESSKFIFTKKSASYAGQTADESQCGVIGCLVFCEKQPPIQVIDHYIHHNHPVPVNPWPWINWPPYTPQPIWAYVCSNTTNIQNSTQVVDYAASDGCSMSVNASNNVFEIKEYTLGTGFGESQPDAVRLVTFEKGSVMAEMSIYYTERDVLVKAGIQVDKTPEVAFSHPQAFGGFCKPPKKVLVAN